MNKVILKGRLTKDPEIRYTNGSTPMCTSRFTLAVEDRGFKEGDEFHVDYITCTAIGKLAEVVEKTTGKGQEIAVYGKWRTSTYEKDGKTCYTQNLFLQELYFCGRKQDNPPRTDSFMNIPEGIDEELPFR